MIRQVRRIVFMGSLAAVASGVLGAGCASGADKGFAAAGGDDASGDVVSTGDDAAAGGDGSKKGKDGSSGDGASGGDAAGSHDGATSGDGAGGGDGGNQGDGSITQGSCTPGAYRCGSGSSVEVCNSSGTAWLYSATCTASCSGGLCTGACSPGATRCNGSNAETCNTAGTAWTVSHSCASTFCAMGECAVAGLDVALNQNLDGVVYVQGAVDVHSGATLSSPTGNLTIYADSITVENGGSIAVAPTGASAAGAGGNGYWDGYEHYLGGGGGGYATAGSGGVSPGQAWGSATDSDVEPGSTGGNGVVPSAANGEYGGAGGGVLRLFAKSITIAGQVTANGAKGQDDLNCYGAGGGGAGGGLLLAADSITVTGSVSATGGGGGKASTCYNSSAGGTGGNGRVKVLWGATHSVTGTLTGTVTQGLLPPLPLSSTSHPVPSLTYNDNFPSLQVSWTHAFPSVQGYYVMLDTSPENPPTPTSGSFISTDFTSFPASALVAGDNYFHIVPTDSMSNVGTIETVFHVRINTSAPAVSSQSHPDQTAWSTNVNPYFQWTFPQGDPNVTGIYYVFDHDGLTVPTASATFLPALQKQLLISNVAPGVWVFHAVSVDQQGYLTKLAGDYRVNIGADPGSGGVLGQVVDSTSQPVSGANISINNGLYVQTTNGTGNYNFTTIPAGTWTVTATANGHSASTMATVASGSAATANLTLP